ncbi:hypothetical protein K7432_008622 [Basidiobolus ranarum]|uniref:Uncharacterized protein n=1 Tax=Basidiobolus ranarum TaxID=34480 RepID=A0ABR2VYA4_9FUNG
MLANARFPSLNFRFSKISNNHIQFPPQDAEFGDMGAYLETENDTLALKECIRRLASRLNSQNNEIAELKQTLEEQKKIEQQVEEKRQILEKENQHHKDKLRETRDHLRELEDQFAEWQSKLATQHQHEIDDLCKRLETEANNSENEIILLTATNEELKMKTSQLNEHIQDLEETVAYVTKQCDLAEQKRLSFDTTIQEMIEKFDRESRKYRQEIIHVTKLRIDLQTKLSSLEQDYENLKQSHTEKCVRLRDLQDENTELRQMVRSNEEIAKLMEDIALD